MDIAKIAPGKKTHILVALALLAGATQYAMGFVEHGFNFQEMLSFVNGEAMTAAISMVRLAIGKK